MKLLCDIRSCLQCAEEVRTIDGEATLFLCPDHQVEYLEFVDSNSFCWDEENSEYVPFEEAYSQWLGQQEAA